MCADCSLLSVFAPSVAPMLPSLPSSDPYQTPEGEAGAGQVDASRAVLTDSCPTCCHHQAVSPGWAPAGPLSPVRNAVQELLPCQRAEEGNDVRRGLRFCPTLKASETFCHT